jgi:hypothetical protein
VKKLVCSRTNSKDNINIGKVALDIRDLHPLELGGLATSTRKEQLSVLRSVAKEIYGPLLNWPADKACTEALARLKRKRKWRWSTMLTKAMSLAVVVWWSQNRKATLC